MFVATENEPVNALLTDRYELTMVAAYHRAGLASRRAVCEMFVRRLPPCRPFLVVAGVERVVQAILDLRFEAEDLAYLAGAPGLRDLGPWFFDALRDFRFRGDLWAMPEGTVAFAGEPILRIEAALPEAQLVETLLLSILNHDIRVASKAARVVLAAEGRPVVEFGTRRTHERAAVDAARAAYIGGCSGTSNEEAGRRYGVPVSGTLAHMFVLAHAADGEERAFRNYVETFPGGAVLLVDTYDVARGVEHAIAAAGPRLQGIRLDSGDPVALSRDARARLDAAGLAAARIVVSDEMNEYRIRRILMDGAAVDVFGVGTEIVTSPDMPALGGIYKLVAVEDGRGALVPVAKRSAGKATYPGAKQVYRRVDAAGRAAGDEIALASEPPREGRPLLVRRIERGAPAGDPAPLERAREHAQREIAGLPEALRAIPPDPSGAVSVEYPIERTPEALALFERALEAGE
jgi:nicotinate phosphoribosyltransferase